MEQTEGAFFSPQIAQKPIQKMNGTTEGPKWAL
jgi:hypothetical protein